MGKETINFTQTLQILKSEGLKILKHKTTVPWMADIICFHPMKYFFHYIPSNSISKLSFICCGFLWCSTLFFSQLFYSPRLSSSGKAATYLPWCRVSDGTLTLSQGWAAFSFPLSLKKHLSVAFHVSPTRSAHELQRWAKQMEVTVWEGRQILSKWSHKYIRNCSV